MEERRHPQSPRPRKRSQMDIFKQDYLPAIIICTAFLLILIFTIGSIARAIQGNKAEKIRQEQVQLSAQQAQEQLDIEAAMLIQQAEAAAADYDYESAIAILDSFTGDASQYPDIVSLRQKYVDEQANLVLWGNNAEVLNLSFHHLVADPERAFYHETDADSYKYHYITTTEFSSILLELYQNDYILVSLDDIFAVETDELGQTYVSSKPLYLPAGKKPVILTQTQVNYYTYLIDGDDEDKLPDKNGDGFASKLILDENGNVTCEMVAADGTVTTGAYDLVPILDSFVATHPEFSYRGAKAILAVTGMEGLFGYRTSAESASYFEEGYQENETAQVLDLISKLRATGYDIACYTYGNLPYGDLEPEGINADMSGWITEVMPILGEIDIFVFAKSSDIADPGTTYSGEKYNKLQSLGFRFYIGFCDNSGNPWQVVTDSYARQGRLMVTGNNLENNPELFSGLFDATALLDITRTN